MPLVLAVFLLSMSSQVLSSTVSIGYIQSNIRADLELPPLDTFNTEANGYRLAAGWQPFKYLGFEAGSYYAGKAKQNLYEAPFTKGYLETEITSIYFSTLGTLPISRYSTFFGGGDHCSGSLSIDIW